MFKALLLVVGLCLTVQARFYLPQGSVPDNGPIVNLYQWTYNDIARECNYLYNIGYGGVQVAPVTENINFPGHPWTEKYEPISYRIASRAGGETEFRNMIETCSEKYIKVYVEVVLNHMTRDVGSVNGSAYSHADTSVLRYPAVPYKKSDFHEACDIKDENDIDQVLQCRVDGRNDLDQSKETVRNKMVDFLNYLIDLGVAGFSIANAGNMLSFDLQKIYRQLNYLNRHINFRRNELAFIYHDVPERGAMDPNNYTMAISNFLGLNTPIISNHPYVTDYKFGLELKKYMTGEKKLKDVRSIASTVESDFALVFIENHFTQRGKGLKEAHLTGNQPREYRLATALMLFLQYGTPMIMSGYSFTDPNQGPPSSGEIIKSVGTDAPEPCENGWTCEHRDNIIRKLVKAAHGSRYAKITNWWERGDDQIAFTKYPAFLLIDLHKRGVSETFTTNLPVGHYCDVFTGHPQKNGTCTGKEIYVYKNGTVEINLESDDPNGAILIYDDDDDSHINFRYIMQRMKRQWTEEAKQDAKENKETA